MTGYLGESINANAALLVERMAASAAMLRIGVSHGSRGERVIDAGASCRGGIEAGRRVAEICMGGLGRVSIVPQPGPGRWHWNVVAASSQPVTACLGSQYAGWNLSLGRDYVAMGSGPARALARKEPLYDDLGYRDTSATATIVLEANAPPPAAIIDKLVQDCGVEASRLNVVFAPTHSLAGSVQIVARVLEVALHAAHEAKYPLDRIVDGMGTAPLAPPHPDFVTALGRTNDAIIYGGRVHLFVTGPASDAQALAAALPSRTSRDYGEPFAAIFKRFKGDFYSIDGKLFSPAEILVTALETGESFRGGGVNWDILDASFS